MQKDIRKYEVQNWKYEVRNKLITHYSSLMNLAETFLSSYIKRSTYYKELADKTFAQLSEANFHYQANDASNSIAIIIQHLVGNMLSRFTNLLTEDGEKEWRNRDTEFEEQQLSKEALLQKWEEGWACYLSAVKNLTEDDLLKTITIRNEELSVVDALNRQLAHYPYHVGQIVYIGRMIKDNQWQSLSIPKGQSQQFNDQMQKP
ncbi:DUF1572 family protein [Lacibacter sediminis]|nr:DUF1572 family protein [Lacibacter sediminis]